MLNSIEMLCDGQIPTGVELCLPDAAVYYVLKGSLEIGDSLLSKGQYLAVEKNETVSFNPIEKTSVSLLRFSFDSLADAELPFGEALGTPYAEELNAFWGEKKLWLPHNSQTAKKCPTMFSLC